MGAEPIGEGRDAPNTNNTNANNNNNNNNNFPNVPGPCPITPRDEISRAGSPLTLTNRQTPTLETPKLQDSIPLFYTWIHWGYL